MWCSLYLMWLGAAMMLLVVWIADGKEKQRIAAIAADVCTEKEHVLSYNATVIANEAGEMCCWFDNDRIERI